MEKNTYYHDGKFLNEEQMINRVKSYYDKPAPRTIKALQMVEGNKILDLGCGTGDVTYAIAKKTPPNGKVIGIDFLEDSIRMAKKMFVSPNLEFRHGNLEELKFQPASFDCIVLFEVIEHVDNPMLLAKKIHKLLKPGGYFVVSTPNGSSLDAFFQNFKSPHDSIKQINSEKGESGTQTDHLYTWSLPLLYRLLHRSGFHYVKHEFAGVGFPFTNIDSKLGTNLSNLFSPLFGRFGMGIILKVRKV